LSKKKHRTAASKVTTEHNRSNIHGRAAIATPVITENNAKTSKNGVYDQKT